jgi:DNA polymerase-3 subunit epsilon
MAGVAVIDLETTGRFFTKDRIVEIGVVLLDAELREEQRWSTLVNPERAVTAEHVHGISATDVRDAPTLRDLADDLAAMLDGRAVVAHNAIFDINFLMLGLQYTGTPTPRALPVVDTMRISSRLLGARSLAHACEIASITLDNAHTAQADALATAELLRRSLGLDLWELPNGTHRYEPHPEQGHWHPAAPALSGSADPWAELLAHGTGTSWSASPTAGRVPRTGYTRAAAASDRRRAEGYLASLVARLPMVDDDPDSDAGPYLALLDEALEDRLITVREAELLVLAADSLGLSRSEVARANTAYLTALAAAAWADGVVTDHERSDIEHVAVLLGLTRADAQQALDSARAGAERRTRSADRIAATPGDRVVFTGEMSRPRAELQRQAISAGLVPTGSISGKTSLLVIADPYSQSGKARKARDLGARIISEQVFDEVCAGMG